MAHGFVCVAALMYFFSNFPAGKMPELLTKLLKENYILYHLLLLFNEFFLSLDQSAELSYQDESLNKFYYKNLSNGTWSSANAQCQALGGSLPSIKSTGKQIFLATSYPMVLWIGLTTDSLRHIRYNKYFMIAFNL